MFATLSERRGSRETCSNKTPAGVSAAFARPSLITRSYVLPHTAQSWTVGTPSYSFTSLATVSFERATKVYPDGTVALEDFSLQIPDGELMVFVGPSGCGKTTALRMVAGLEEITEGEIRIGTEVVNGLPPRDRDVAMVFQNYALYPHKSVYDNLSFPLKLRRMGKQEIDERVRRMARVLELEEQLSRKPRQLSGGQRQRVAMGRAIIREPQAFLMDEPLSNLDAKLRTQMRAEISLLHKEIGVTTIYVTHDQVEAMTLGQRVAVMRKGELQQVAAPAELYNRPLNLFVAGFIGSPAMNFFEGALDSSDGVVAVTFGDGQRLAVDGAERDAGQGNREHARAQSGLRDSPGAPRGRGAGARDGG